MSFLPVAVPGVCMLIFPLGLAGSTVCVFISLGYQLNPRIVHTFYLRLSSSMKTIRSSTCRNSRVTCEYELLPLVFDPYYSCLAWLLFVQYGVSIISSVVMPTSKPSNSTLHKSEHGWVLYFIRPLVIHITEKCYLDTTIRTKV